MAKTGQVREIKNWNSQRGGRGMVMQVKGQK